MYFDINTVGHCTPDNLTSSKYNLPFAAFGLNLLVHIITVTPPDKIGIITPYVAQKTAYLRALDKLHKQDPSKNYQSVKVDTIDSFQGSERHVIIFDTVITDKPGFMERKERLLVAMTRARDFQVIICRTSTLQSSRGKNPELLQLYEMAQKDGQCYTVDYGHEWFNHYAIAPPVRFTMAELGQMRLADVPQYTAIFNGVKDIPADELEAMRNSVSGYTYTGRPTPAW